MLTVSCDCPAEMIAVLSLITNGCRLWLHGLRGERRANRRLEGLDGQGRLCYVVVRPGWYFRGHHFDSRVLKLRFRFSIFDLLLRPNQVRFMNSRINVSAVPPYEIQSRVAYVIKRAHREMASTRSRPLRTWFLRSNSLVSLDRPRYIPK
jgi:hypothetical protein